MNHDFDRIIDRRDTYSIKHEPAWRGKPPDVLPLWVADMDFLTPPCVRDALVSRARHGIYGYAEPDAAYFDTLRAWFESRFGWSPERDWLTFAPGVVTALNVAIRALTAPGDGVVIQQPVYYPFESCIRQTGRRLLVNALVLSDGRYTINFADFEDNIRRAKLFILCNPHNPVGRVWTRDELLRIGEICLRHRVTVIADEIHADFIYPGHRHLVFSALHPDFAANTVTCTSPSKTFNLAGLQHANIFIPDKTLRGKFKAAHSDCGLSQPSLMGLVACKAAYEGGAEWLAQLLDYLAGNMAFLSDGLASRIPQIKLIEAEGTYLAWLDCTALGLTDPELDDALTRKARLWLSAGHTFGQGGSGFQRMNVACPRTILREALERLSRWVVASHDGGDRRHHFSCKK